MDEYNNGCDQPSELPVLIEQPEQSYEQTGYSSPAPEIVYDDTPKPDQTLAIVGLVMSIAGIVLGCCGAVLTLPLGLIFSIVGTIIPVICLIKKKDGRELSIIALVMGIAGDIGGLVFLFFWLFIGALAFAATGIFL